jgi:hypothetical protein
MREQNEYNERALMVLVRESRRMENTAERVRLVVEAMAKKNGVRTEPVEGDG